MVVRLPTITAMTPHRTHTRIGYLQVAFNRQEHAINNSDEVATAKLIRIVENGTSN